MIVSNPRQTWSELQLTIMDLADPDGTRTRFLFNPVSPPCDSRFRR